MWSDVTHLGLFGFLTMWKKKQTKGEILKVQINEVILTRGL